MKILAVILVLMTTLISGLAQAEVCIVHISTPAKGSAPQTLASSKVVTLTYDPQNQIDGGDTIFMYTKVTADLVVLRESHFIDGSPELSIIDAKTNKTLKHTYVEGSKEKPAGSFAEISTTYKNQIFQIVCE